MQHAISEISSRRSDLGDLISTYLPRVLLDRRVHRAEAADAQDAELVEVVVAHVLLLHAARLHVLVHVPAILGRWLCTYLSMYLPY